MRDAIAPDRRAWRVLGFSSAPRTGVRPPHTGLRMDPYEEGVIAECKNVLSGLETLRQLDGYLQLCDRRPSRTWQANIIVSAGYTTELARAVAARPDVRLWGGRQSTHGHPDLDEVRLEPLRSPHQQGRINADVRRPPREGTRLRRARCGGRPVTMSVTAMPTLSAHRRSGNGGVVPVGTGRYVDAADSGRPGRVASAISQELVTRYTRYSTAGPGSSRPSPRKTAWFTQAYRSSPVSSRGFVKKYWSP